MTAVKSIKVAGVQVPSRNLDTEGNLHRAEPLVAIAASRGAELVLCPEFLAAGYIYDPSIWEAAEPAGGPTELWLARMARQHSIYIGASYLEASGDDFFNTFTLTTPGGSAAGRVRKESLPGFEGCFFRSCSGPKVIETPLGRVGVGICFDNLTTRFMRKVSEDNVDLLLMPHSGPRMTLGPVSLGGDNVPGMLRDVAGFYAAAFGIPTVMANKAAGEDSLSPVPWVPLVRLRFHFVGQSTIAGAGGSVCDQLDEEEGVVVAEVALDPARKRQPALPSGYWSRPPPLWPRFPLASAAMFQVVEWVSTTTYALSRARRASARRVATRHCSRGAGFQPAKSV
jgi:N-carbamoylputrescine amidase